MECVVMKTEDIKREFDLKYYKELETMKKLIQKFGFDRTEMLTRVPQRTLRHWVAGTRKPPYYVVLMTVAALEDFELREKYDEHLGDPAYEN